MLDLITLFSAVGLQQEMTESDKAKLVIHDGEIQTGSVVEDVAEQVSSAIDSFEGAVSAGLESLFGGKPAAETVPVKKIA